MLGSFSLRGLRGPLGAKIGLVSNGPHSGSKGIESSLAIGRPYEMIAAYSVMTECVGVKK